jgi:diadenosine tetraphosphate (Ap4A) HIT family hydrolase
MKGDPYTFLNIPASYHLASNDLAFAVLDGFPVSPGHVLVVPRRLEADYFRLTPEEQQALWELVGVVAAKIEARLGADGYTLGLNIGEAAGQTVPHVHVHVIPRRLGDVPDPRGGIRWVLPDKAAYWTP